MNPKLEERKKQLFIQNAKQSRPNKKEMNGVEWMVVRGFLFFCFFEKWLEP